MNNKVKIIISAVVVIILVVLGIFSYMSPGSRPVTYVEDDYDFSIDIPIDWVYRDDLTLEKCCLFVAYWSNSTTTTMNASGTPQEKVTAMEHVKLQIGYYDKSKTDPFQAASTTKITLGKNDFYMGRTDGVEFYLLPRNENEGVGVALFAYQETTQEFKDKAIDIISTIKLLPYSAPEPVDSAATTTGR